MGKSWGNLDHNGAVVSERGRREMNPQVELRHLTIYQSIREIC